MLNQNRSERKNSFKYAFVLPLLVGFTLLFNVKTIAQVKSLDSIQEDTKKYGPVNYDKEHSGDFPIVDKSNLQSPFYIGDTVPLYIVDGKKMSKTEFDKIEHNEIASINVYKSHQAIEKYGEEACNGVIEQYVAVNQFSKIMLREWDQNNPFERFNWFEIVININQLFEL